MKRLLYLLVLAILLIVPASATITITPTNVTGTSILWTWSPTTITNMSIDGVLVCGFDPTATSFTLSGLGPNEPHTIVLVTAGDTGANTTYTLGNTNTEQSTGVMSLINTWWYLVLIPILCVVGMGRKLGIFLIVAAAVSLYALYDLLQRATPGTTPYTQIPFIIYLIFFIVPLWLCWGVKGGVFK